MEALKVFEDPKEFGEIVTLMRNELLGVSQQKIPIKKLSKQYGFEDPSFLQEALECLGYLILHMVKVKASEEEFVLLYMQSGLP